MEEPVFCFGDPLFFLDFFFLGGGNPASETKLPSPLLQHGTSFVSVKFRPLDLSPDSLVVLDECGSLLLLTWVCSWSS